MVKYCPSCRAKVKEGSKFCLSCGTKLQEEISGVQATQASSAQTTSYQQLVHKQTYASKQQKESKKGFIIAVIAIIAIVVIIVTVLFLIGGTLSGKASKFVGTWEYYIGGDYLADIKFNSDKSLTYSISGYSIKIGTWDVRNNKLIWEITMSDIELSSQEFDYEFSNGGNTLTLISGGNNYMTLTKK